MSRLTKVFRRSNQGSENDDWWMVREKVLSRLLVRWCVNFMVGAEERALKQLSVSETPQESAKEIQSYARLLLWLVRMAGLLKPDKTEGSDMEVPEFNVVQATKDQSKELSSSPTPVSKSRGDFISSPSTLSFSWPSMFVGDDDIFATSLRRPRSVVFPL
ncbi:hypothetical protein F2Q70_00019504 [Brassica cretica]|uniref:Uncharacterized protein n=1 Tax=Brassica cretica TaxID=69181 RepID=A0A8S9GMY9_BRACR|nr:hypothetical protein F2Q70_00019504 [Brassica cretica]